MGPPVFKTGVGARAPRRVRFPSASAKCLLTCDKAPATWPSQMTGGPTRQGHRAEQAWRLPNRCVGVAPRGGPFRRSLAVPSLPSQGADAAAVMGAVAEAGSPGRSMTGTASARGRHSRTCVGRKPPGGLDSGPPPRGFRRLPWSPTRPGLPHVTQQLQHVSMPSAITAELLRRGWTEADVRKVLSGHALQEGRRNRRGVTALAEGPIHTC